MDKRERERIADGIAVALTGNAFLLVGALLAWLIQLGLDWSTARWFADMVMNPSPAFESGLSVKGPCLVAEEALERGWLTLYIMAGAERLTEAGRASGWTGEQLAYAKMVEAGYYASHLRAQDRRYRAAASQDITAHLFADEDHLLSWRTVIDEKTTLECRWANGRNFDAREMPCIGWPGAVHVRCRCTAGPAVLGAPLIPPA